MHRTVTNTILSILLIALIIIVLPANAFAASASASVSSSTVKPGDTVTVTVTFRGTDIGVVDGTFSYDPSILQYTGGSGTSGGGGSGLIKLVTSAPNSSSLSATMTFKALKAGSATVSATAGLILSYHEEKSLGTASASARVTVKAPGSSSSSSKPNNNSSSNTNTSNNTDSSKPKTSEPNTKEEKEESPTNPVEGTIKVTMGDKELYLWKDLSSVKLPDGFKSGEAFYKTVKIQAAVGENRNITLVYLTDEKGENGSFYILDNDKLYPYITLNTTSTYTILQLDDPAKLPEGYKETELKLGNQTVQAWQLESGEHPDFYLLYVMNDKGERDFYLYDQAEKTMQRYTDRTVMTEPAPQTFIEKLTSDTTLLAVVGALGALSIILLIILIVLYIRIRQYFGRTKTYYSTDFPDSRFF